eukprot:Tamp_22166.p1 GENE.Tamp_22166~~Tamp_22166.p1  ORF type:complete len:340 (+),score=108.68 Tamp_22166:149-1021(+)
MALDSRHAGTRADRRALLEFAGKAALVPLFVGAADPRAAAAASKEVDAVAKIPLDVLKAIAGGSDKEFKSLKEGYESDLSGVELELYQAYLYGAEKIPQTEDPRASLRPLFESKMSDNLIKFAQSNGISPKVYDARGDGLTNTGKGGVLKGCRVLLDGWKSKGFIQDYTLDTSGHDENAWQQGNAASAISVVVKKPVGLAASNALADEEAPQLQLSLVANLVSGYMRQCKVVSDFKVDPTADGEKISFTLSWAGKARLAQSIQRRSNDKFNTARAFKKEDKKKAEEEEEE